MTIRFQRWPAAHAAHFSLNILELIQPQLDLDNNVFNVELQRGTPAKPNLTYCLVPWPFLVLQNCAEPHLLRLKHVKIYMSMLLFRVCATCTTPTLENFTSGLHTLHRECPSSAKCYGVDEQWGCSGDDCATLAPECKRVDWPLQCINNK